MKFRAVMRNTLYMRELLNTILTLSKLTKESVMIINEDKVEFIINEELASPAPLVWTEITSIAYFDEYKMKGIDDENPHIFLSFNPANLGCALSTVRNIVTFVKFKLTNKQYPCLSVDIEIPPSNIADTRKITHDVPIDVIPYRDWIKYQVPNIKEPQIILEMPNIRLMRNLLDKIKNISPVITFGATIEGELSIIAETDSAMVASHYRDLKIKQLHQEKSDENIVNNLSDFSCVIDCKKAAIFLSALQLSNYEITFGIIQDHLVLITIKIRSGVTLLCIIPALCM